MVPKEVFEFLVELSINNNREWFQDNKSKYQQAKESFEEYTNQLIGIIHSIDKTIGHPHAKDCTFRIYRDVRFSKNKEPYKNNMGAYIAHGGRKSPYAGYYVHIEPDNSFMGGGIYMPQPAVLKSIRESIIENVDEYKAIVDEPTFTKTFPEIWGEKLKTAPKGFDKTDPNIDLIRNKSYAVTIKLSDKQIQSKSLEDKIKTTFTTMKPFNDFMNHAVKNSL
ncbi:DUF2461 domain-containing protein [Labilibacter marinus]|uniref:DUF2461 domain-containing protein n=1 Tax=Labilibacter marinus TaxID=1477105 RepID=UPI00094F6894|nr:DUF2461 domain-containing protein [Labilibacter marinus]